MKKDVKCFKYSILCSIIEQCSVYKARINFMKDFFLVKWHWLTDEHGVMNCSLASHEQHGNAEKIIKNWGNSYPYYPSEDEVNEAANLSVSGIAEKDKILILSE